MSKGFGKQLEEHSKTLKALGELEGEICAVKYDPHDPVSIENAINHMETVLDNKMRRYANNELVKPIIQQTKDSFRRQLLDKAAALRLQDSVETDE